MTDVRPGSWAPVLGYGAVSAANQMLWLTFTPITTDAAHHYAVSSGAIGWLAELFPLLYVVLALPAGRLLDRDLPRWLAAGAVLTALGALIRLQDGYAAVLAGQVLVAVAQPLVLNAVTAVSSRYLAEDDRSTGIAVSSASIFGGMLVALVLGAVLGGSRIPALVLVQAILAVVAAVALCLALRRPAGFRAPAVEADVSGLRAVWADHGMRRLTGLVCAGFGVFIALTTWLQALLKPAGVSDTAAGYLLLAMVVAGVAASALVPPVIERRRAQARFVGASVVAGVLGLLMLAIVPGLWTGLVALVLIGAFLLTDLPVVLGLAERRAGSAGATASALIWLAGNAAGLVAALVVQAVLHRPTIAFVVLAVMLAVAVPLVRGIGDAPGLAVPAPVAEPVTDPAG